jgi:nucleotide-binding universal stress UspA family protein
MPLVAGSSGATVWVAARDGGVVRPVGREGKEAEMFEQILLAVDGSEHSKKAAAAAADIAKKPGGEVHVLYIHEVGLFAPVESTAEAQALVDGVVEQLQGGGVKASGDAIAARSGSVAPSILEAARSLGSDLIVMGTRGLSDFSGLLLGSVAHKVIHHADCPVLVVR